MIGAQFEEGPGKALLCLRAPQQPGYMALPIEEQILRAHHLSGYCGFFRNSLTYTPPMNSSLAPPSCCCVPGSW